MNGWENQKDQCIDSNQILRKIERNLLTEKQKITKLKLLRLEKNSFSLSKWCLKWTILHSWLEDEEKNKTQVNSFINQVWKKQKIRVRCKGLIEPQDIL